MTTTAQNTMNITTNDAPWITDGRRIEIEQQLNQHQSMVMRVSPQEAQELLEQLTALLAN